MLRHRIARAPLRSGGVPRDHNEKVEARRRPPDEWVGLP
jgi:hypothetical protein